MDLIGSWLWIIGIGLFFFGVASGLALANFSHSLRSRRQNLQKELQDLNKEYQVYRSEVNQHFVTSAQLINNLNQSYRHVFDHLALSSEHLCGGSLAKALDFNNQKNLFENSQTEMIGLLTGQPHAKNEEIEYTQSTSDQSSEENEIIDKDADSTETGHTDTSESNQAAVVNTDAAADTNKQGNDETDTAANYAAGAKYEILEQTSKKPDNEMNSGEIMVLNSEEKPAKKAQNRRRVVKHKKATATTTATKRQNRKKSTATTVKKQAAPSKQANKNQTEKPTANAKTKKSTGQDWLPVDVKQATI